MLAVCGLIEIIYRASGMLIDSVISPLSPAASALGNPDEAVAACLIKLVKPVFSTFCLPSKVIPGSCAGTATPKKHTQKTPEPPRSQTTSYIYNLYRVFAVCRPDICLTDVTVYLRCL